MPFQKLGRTGLLLSASIHQSPALRVTRQLTAEIRNSWSLHPGIDSDAFREMNRLSNRRSPPDESRGWHTLVPTWFQRRAEKPADCPNPSTFQTTSEPVGHEDERLRAYSNRSRVLL